VFTSTRIVPLPVTAEAAQGVRAVRLHMVLAKAVEATPYQVCQDRPMRLPQRRGLDGDLSPLFVAVYHLPTGLDVSRVQRRGGVMASGRTAGVGHEALVTTTHLRSS
jgi:hypothetical protein